MNCDKCEEQFDELYGKGTYNGNKDTGYYCLDCYKEVFDEDFE